MATKRNHDFTATLNIYFLHMVCISILYGCSCRRWGSWQPKYDITNNLWDPFLFIVLNLSIFVLLGLWRPPFVSCLPLEVLFILRVLRSSSVKGCLQFKSRYPSDWSPQVDYKILVTSVQWIVRLCVILKMCNKLKKF
jgi:hypothetical protein